MSNRLSEAEEKRRATMLEECFNACDKGHKGYLQASDLKAVARAFNPDGDTEAEVKLVMETLDQDKDGRVTIPEWSTFLIDFFKFMNKEAFDKHCEELLNVLIRKIPPSRASSGAP